jgi:chromosome partitioning protein
MVITCPSCKKQHDIDEKLIPPNVSMARCKQCGRRFQLPKAASPSPTTEQAGPAGPEQKKVRKIGVSLSKGGVGKTTTSVNLAAGLALAGFKVLLIDTDTQGQDSFMLGLKPKAGLTELVTEELSAEEAIVKARENLWLLAGGRSLAGIKRLIDRKDFGGEKTLVESLAPLETQYDYIIVDTSPGWDPLTVNVLFFVNELLTPVSLEMMTLQGLVEFLRSISSIQKYRKDISLKYILPTFLDTRIKQSQVIMDKLEHLYGELVCTPIRYNITLSTAPAHGKTIFEFAPGCPGSHDYRELVKKIADDQSLFT